MTKIRMDNGDQYVLTHIGFDKVLEQWDAAVKHANRVLTISSDDANKPRIAIALDHIAAVIDEGGL